MTDEKLREAICSGVAQLLKEERLRQGLSLNKAGEKAGVSRQMVAYVEQCERNPSLDVLMRMTDVLGVKLEDIIAKARKRSVGRRQG